MRFIPPTLVLAALAVVAVAAVLTAPAPAARAESPFVSYSSPKDGDVVSAVPPLLVLCFRNPIDIAETSLADYRFSLTPAGGALLPLRVFLQNDGYGIVAQPRQPTGDTTGEWTFEWKVRDAGTKGVEEGSTTFRVDPSGQPPLRSLAGPCTASGMASPTPQPAASGSSNTTTSAGDSVRPDVLLMSLLTLAGAGGLALIGFIGYAIRMRVGFWLHRPPAPGEQAGAPEHH